MRTSGKTNSPPPIYIGQAQVEEKKHKKRGVKIGPGTSLHIFWVEPPSASWRWQWQPTPVLLPGKSHGQRSLVGCSPWGHGESDTTEQLHFHALEKAMATHSSVLAWRIPGTGGAWWAAIYGVAQSRTRLK